MRNQWGKACLGLLCLIFTFASVAAQETQEKSRFSVTPRIWLGQFNTVEFEGERIEAFVIPLSGLTFTFSPRSLPNTNFLLTALTGDGDGDFVYFGFPGGQSEAERDDIELLIRYNFPDKLLSIYYGVRFVDFNTTSAISTCPSSLDPICGFWFPLNKSVTDSELWVVEIGVGGVTDITEDSSHRLFAYFTLGAGFSDFDFVQIEGPATFIESGSSTDLVYDINFGYQWHISSNISFNARYRGFIIADEDDNGHTRLNTIHGPDVGLTIRF